MVSKFLEHLRYHSVGISRSYATNAIKVDHFTFQMLGVVQRMGPADVLVACCTRL